MEARVRLLGVMIKLKSLISHVRIATGTKQIQDIESVQRRAARRSCYKREPGTVMSLLNVNGPRSLEIRRKIAN